MKSPSIKEIQDKGRLLDGSFAKEPHPVNGFAYWRYAVYVYHGKLCVIEAEPEGDGLKYILKQINY